MVWPPLREVARLQVSPIHRDSVTTLAIARIEDAIVDGRLPPGSKLPPERELAELLGISRSSLREVIRVLTHLNILESRHGHGTYVTSLSPALLMQPLRFVLAVDDTAILELFQVRRMIETSAAAIAATSLPGAALDVLRDHLSAMERSVTASRSFLEHDLAMHVSIVAAVGNELLSALYETVLALARDIRVRAADETVRARSLEQHRLLLDALERRDAKASVRAMDAHLAYFEEQVRALLAAEREEAL